MDDFGSLLFLLFVLWPILAGILRRRQGTQPPGGGRGGPRAGQRPASAGRPRTEEEPQTAAPVSAADMIPDELWEILTGERRRPAPMGAPRLPVPAEEEEEEAPRRMAWEEEDQAEEEDGTEEEWEPVVPARRAPRPAVSLEVDPVIVSLEESVPSTEERHAAFHARVDAPARKGRPRRRRRLRLNLGDPDELRRMMVLREVLGPPKALE